MRNQNSVVCPSPRLFLEHGADESTTGRLHVQERGATFESPWHFRPMDELNVCLAWRHERLGPQRTPVQGVVIESRKIGRARYETTVIFLELPDEQKEGVRAFARLMRLDCAE